MSFYFNRASFKDQLSLLEQVEEWLSKVGLQIENTRFSEILDLNRLIIKHTEQGTLDFLINKYGSIKLWYAITEASLFIEIYEAFKKEKSHIHRRAKLKQMIGGPFYPWDENPKKNNIENRNTLFELETAAKFKLAGAKIKGFDDVDFIFKNTRFNVQCKKLHSLKNTKYNIDQAVQQFTKKMKKKKGLKGIIALSLDKVTEKETSILKVRSPNDIRPTLSKISNDFLNQHRKKWKDLLNINILGVILFVHIVAIIEEEPHDLLTTCRDIAFDIIPQKNFFQHNDYYLLKDLGLRMQNSD